MAIKRHLSSSSRIVEAFQHVVSQPAPYCWCGQALSLSLSLYKYIYIYIHIHTLTFAGFFGRSPPGGSSDVITGVVDHFVRRRPEVILLRPGRCRRRNAEMIGEVSFDQGTISSVETLRSILWRHCPMSTSTRNGHDESATQKKHQNIQKA